MQTISLKKCSDFSNTMEAKTLINNSHLDDLVSEECIWNLKYLKATGICTAFCGEPLLPTYRERHRCPSCHLSSLLCANNIKSRGGYLVIARKYLVIGKLPRNPYDWWRIPEERGVGGNHKKYLSSRRLNIYGMFINVRQATLTSLRNTSPGLVHIIVSIYYSNFILENIQHIPWPGSYVLYPHLGLTSFVLQ